MKCQKIHGVNLTTEVLDYTS